MVIRFYTISEKGISMKANIKRANSTVKISIGPTPADPDRNYSFEFECGDADHAELMMRYLRDGIGSLLESERRKYYEQGWRDAKSKRRKHGWFPSCLKETEP